jgi:chemotaxis protein MotB
MAEKREVEPPAEMGAPLYILSFGDMMTNLLCFFVLLCAFSSSQQAGFISDGIGSLRSTLLSRGLPGVLHGDRLPIDLGANRVMFRPAKSVAPSLLTDANGEVSDGNRDALREVVLEALRKEGAREIPVPLIFLPGSAVLSDEHRSALREIAPMLARGHYPVRVEGYAYEEGIDFRDAWALAILRAENTASFLAEAGDIDRGRLLPCGYGPPTSRAEISPRQNFHGRRVVILSLVRTEERR